MKLIKVLKFNDRYEITALITYKFLKIQILSVEKVFIKKENKDYWQDAKNHEKVSVSNKLKLDRWLKDHQKFIEKRVG